MNIVPWEITTGCERLTEGCDNCPTYWEAEANGWDYHPKFHSSRLRDPYEMIPPVNIAVSPGSDLMHEAITKKQIMSVVDVIKATPHNHYEIGTKRAERLVALDIAWPDNCSVGIPVEESKYKWRIDMLREVDVKSKMIMFGPMTGRVGELNLEAIDYAGVVVEAWGPNPRKVEQSWVDEIKVQCEEWNVRYVSKHWVSKETI